MNSMAESGKQICSRPSYEDNMPDVAKGVVSGLVLAIVWDTKFERLETCTVNDVLLLTVELAVTGDARVWLSPVFGASPSEKLGLELATLEGPYDVVCPDAKSNDCPADSGIATPV